MGIVLASYLVRGASTTAAMVTLSEELVLPLPRATRHAACGPRHAARGIERMFRVGGEAPSSPRAAQCTGDIGMHPGYSSTRLAGFIRA